MNYFITRDGQQYGPYTLADLQRYVTSGEVLLSDLARSEGMSEPLMVSQIIGTITVAQPQASMVATGNVPVYADPPNLHWALVLLFGILTCGLFNAAWSLVQAAWMKKVAPQSTAIYYYVAAICCLVAIFVASFAAAYAHTRSTAASGLNIVYGVLLLIGRFSLRNSLEQHYTTVDPIGLTLSGVMTFFFADIYFQYHINDIVRRKSAAHLGQFPA